MRSLFSVAICLTALGFSAVGTAPVFAQVAPETSAAPDPSAERTPVPERAAVERAPRDLIVPAGFGGPPSSSNAPSELIVPEIFRDRGTPSPIRTPSEWQRERAAPSELRVPAIFRATAEQPGFDPPRINDRLRIPEAFRVRPAPDRERTYRVREELRAPGFPPRAETPRAAPSPSPTPGMGRRLDSPLA